MYYQIFVDNGHYPLSYRCSTAAEAYGCMETLASGLMQDRELDLDEIMQDVVDLKRRALLEVSRPSRYTIMRCEGEI